jgi:hypothetical protein
MAITAAQAIAKIQSGMTIAQLRNLMNQVDADPHAAIAKLYSGALFISSKPSLLRKRV